MFILSRPDAGEAKVEELRPVFTQEQSDRAWAAIIRAYIKKHPESILTEKERAG